MGHRGLLRRRLRLLHARRDRCADALQVFVDHADAQVDAEQLAHELDTDVIRELVAVHKERARRLYLPRRPRRLRSAGSATAETKQRVTLQLGGCHQFGSELAHLVADRLRIISSEPLIASLTAGRFTGNDGVDLLDRDEGALVPLVLELSASALRGLLLLARR